jgi:hypothetical protein
MKAEKQGKLFIILLIFTILSCTSTKPIINSKTKENLFCTDEQCAQCDSFIADTIMTGLKFFVKTSENIYSKKKWSKYCYFGITTDAYFKYNTEYVPYIYNFLITDKDVIFNYLFPYMEEDLQEAILYSYSYNRDTTFKNLIDYNKKTIVNDHLFFFPILDLNINYIVMYSYHTQSTIIDFVHVLKERKIFEYCSCINEKKLGIIKIYIPILIQGK